SSPRRTQLDHKKDRAFSLNPAPHLSIVTAGSAHTDLATIDSYADRGQRGCSSGPACARVVDDMINYTDQITGLMRDIVARVPDLRFIAPDDLLVFGRFGRSGADGPFATCHCLSLPPSEPGYYFWRDRRSGRLTRRSEWFVTKSPRVSLESRPVHYMISFALPRFCDQTLVRSRKRALYPGREPWVGKLDTVVHELYHIAPSGEGLRRMHRADGSESSLIHSPEFFADVVRMVNE